MDTAYAELEVSKSSGIHHAARQTKDILALVEVVREAELLNHAKRSLHSLVLTETF